MADAQTPQQTIGEESGGCPVKHSSNLNQTLPPKASASNSFSWPLSSWLRRTPNGDNPTGTSITATRDTRNDTTPFGTANTPSQGCPVKHNNNNNNNNNDKKNMGLAAAALPASIEEAARHPQSPLPDQIVPLSTRRVVSSIPRADEMRTSTNKDNNSTTAKAAPHQPPHTNWVYPSEQQFYNAMRRKGYTIQDEATIPHVVRIHNAVNERGWNEIRQWEALRHNPNPRLVRFLGRPTDLSPRAWFRSTFGLALPPFDRHDWYVDRGDGTGQRRYVIDFYQGDETTSTSIPNHANTIKPPSMYLDVRPALDDLDAVSDRTKMFFKDAFPGIYFFVYGTGTGTGTQTDTGIGRTHASTASANGGANSNH